MAALIEPLAPEPGAAPGADMTARLRAHHGAAWIWALACCRGDRESAHEVLHDAYVKTLEGRATFAGRSSFKTWLFGVIRFCALNARRKALLTNLLLVPIPNDTQFAAPPDAPPRDARFPAAIAALPERQRQIIALVFEHDQTIDEAAHILRIAPGSARRHYARAKEKLRAALTMIEDRHDG